MYQDAKFFEKILKKNGVINKKRHTVTFEPNEPTPTKKIELKYIVGKRENISGLDLSEYFEIYDPWHLLDEMICRQNIADRRNGEVLNWIREESGESEK